MSDACQPSGKEAPSGLEGRRQQVSYLRLVDDDTYAATLYARLAAYAGRPGTAGRAVSSYGAVDHALGGLAALLGRGDEAVRHLRAAIKRNEELGCAVWRQHAQRRLARIAPEDPLVTPASRSA